MATSRKQLKAVPAKTASKVVATPKPRTTLNPQAMIAQVDPVNLPTESGDMVTVTIPKAFNLTLDDHTQVRYEAGIDEIPIEHASHWWAQAQGVEIYTKKRGE